MVVSSKYNIGDSVWFIDDNKVQALKITGVSIMVDGSGVRVEYTLHNDIHHIDENKLFKTKEDLLKSL